MKQLKHGKRENGVVLLAAMVFLLVLLVMLGFVLKSSRQDEMKSGADFDETTAKEVANLALQDAENYIMRRDYAGNVLYFDGSSESKIDAKDVQTKADADNKSVEEYMVGNAHKYWSEKIKVWKVDGDGSAEIKGMYDGLKAATSPAGYACREEGCGLDDEWKKANCDPDKFLCLNALNTYNSGMEKLKGGITNQQAKYVVEVFKGDNKALNLDSGNDDMLIFRVTAVGFAQNPTQNADATQVMLQATYMLSAQ